MKFVFTWPRKFYLTRRYCSSFRSDEWCLAKFRITENPTEGIAKCKITLSVRENIVQIFIYSINLLKRTKKFGVVSTYEFVQNDKVSSWIAVWNRTFRCVNLSVFWWLDAMIEEAEWFFARRAFHFDSAPFDEALKATNVTAAWKGLVVMRA